MTDAMREAIGVTKDAYRKSLLEQNPLNLDYQAAMISAVVAAAPLCKNLPDRED